MAGSITNTQMTPSRCSSQWSELSGLLPLRRGRRAAGQQQVGTVGLNRGGDVLPAETGAEQLVLSIIVQQKWFPSAGHGAGMDLQAHVCTAAQAACGSGDVADRQLP